jgi:beta-lactamase regulating signal transducer with metallopeptidase domain
MLQYLINATAIWTVSLLLFDLLLRRERAHGYNRFYLLFTLLAGAVLPLLPWSYTIDIYPTLVQPTVSRVAEVRAAAVQAAAAAAPVPVDIPWLLLLYFSGACISLFMLLVEIWKLLRLISHGHHSPEDNWHVIETGQPHAPFSLLHRLYVSSRSQYSPQEWQMILAHEGRHTSLLHFADLMLLHFLRVLFWFHPLVYIYHRRLLLVHEYQADATAENPAKFGHFLLEQAVFHATPSITHSLNRSPIKNRINMLTNTNTRSTGAKKLALLPLLAFSIICCAQNSNGKFAPAGKGYKLPGTNIAFSTYKEDSFFSAATTTTVIRINPPRPVMLNGKEVAHLNGEVPTPYGGAIMSASERFKEYLFNAVKGDLERLPDGEYQLSPQHATFDETGKLCYFEFASIVDKPAPGGGAYLQGPWQAGGIDPAMQKDIENKIAKAIQASPKMPVIKVEGQAMPYGIEQFSVRVRDHKILTLVPPLASSY